MEKALTNTNSQELINQAKELSGSRGNFIPYIPIININNQNLEKEVEVDGMMTKVEVPAKEGFNITLKDDKANEYISQYYTDKLEAVMLRIRYSISSKYKLKPKFYSYEFNHFDDIIKIYDENKEILIESNYAEIKKFFATGEKNSLGKPKSAAELRIVIYVDIEGEIYRVKLNNASRSNFFKYIKTFGNNDTFTAYKTKFNLKFNDQGAIKFWYVDFKKGESVDLAKEIPLQQELQKFFNVEKFVKQDYQNQDNDYAVEEIVEEEPKNDEINLSQIPF